MVILADIRKARCVFHEHICRDILRIDRKGLATNADPTNSLSKEIACSLAIRLGAKCGRRPAARGVINHFERICAEFVTRTTRALSMILPMALAVARTNALDSENIEASGHPNLKQLAHLLLQRPLPKLLFNRGNFITPAILVFSLSPARDQFSGLMRPASEGHTGFAYSRRKPLGLPHLRASISCIWSMQSRMPQKLRPTEPDGGNDPGNGPHHFGLITAEPLPSRLVLAASRPSDVNCVYHIALHELADAIEALKGHEDSRETLAMLIEGKRLRDISDLPLDLAF